MRREMAYNELDRVSGGSAGEALFVLRLKANEDAGYEELVRVDNSSMLHVSYRLFGDFEVFSYSEIADVFGISIGTVKSRIARARSDLKKSLMRYLSVQRV